MKKNLTGIIPLNYQMFESSTLVQFNQSYFLIAKSLSRQYALDGPIYSYLVFELTSDKENIKSISFFYNGYEDDELNVFGDFASNGKLGYLSWGQYDGIIRLYEYENNEFILDNKHFLNVEMSPSQKRDFGYKKLGREMEHRMNLDVKRSKWFYPLTGKYKLIM
jgi:hypothetical protein